MQPKNRVTVVEQVAFQPFGEQPVSVSRAYARELDSDQQFYKRTLKVGEEWQRLDCGWLDECDIGLIVICNEAGTNLQRVPTKEERAAIEAQVLEVSYNPALADSWTVPPGAAMRGYPSRSQNLFLRSRSGEIVVSIFLTPR